MCSFGPIILGHQHPKVERPRPRQRAHGDTQPGPARAWSSSPSCLTQRVDHAEWAMFAKNGTDATSLCRRRSPGRPPAAANVLRPPDARTTAARVLA